MFNFNETLPKELLEIINLYIVQKKIINHIKKKTKKLLIKNNDLEEDNLNLQYENLILLEEIDKTSILFNEEINRKNTKINSLFEEINRKNTIINSLFEEINRKNSLIKSLKNRIKFYTENPFELKAMEGNTKLPLDKEEVHHIAMWMPNWIGDVVLVLPTLQMLRSRYPNARITAIVRVPSDELLSYCRDLDSVIKFPKKKGDGFFKQLHYAYGLRKYRFDVGIIFPNSLHSAIMLMLARARFRIGYATEGRRLFLTHSLPVTSEEKKTLYTD